MKKICYVGLLIIGSVALISALPVYNLTLERSIINLINNNKIESSAFLGDLFGTYQDLEQSRIGREYAIENHREVEKNPIYLKTNLLNKAASTDSRTIFYERVQYQTSLSGKLHNTSGLIIFPPTKKPKGVVLYFHPTVFGKVAVPSLKFSEFKTEMLAATFAADGYIVIAPDYIGLGDDFMNEHPYVLYPKLNVLDAKNMLLASVNAIKIKHNNLNYQNIPLYVSGFSEGALYALWFSRLYQESSGFYKDLRLSGYNLKQTVATSGPYDVSHVMVPFLLSNQINQTSNYYNVNTTMWGTLLKPALFANTLMAYSAYEGVKPLDLFKGKFYNLECVNGYPICFSVDKQHEYSIDTVRLINLNQMKMALNYYFSALGVSGESNEMYGVFNNSVSTLLKSREFQEPVLKVAANADIINWKSTSPVTLVSLSNDSVVPVANSDNAYNGMVESGSLNLKYIKVKSSSLKARAFVGPDEIDHINFEIYSLLITLKEFQDH